MAKRYCDTNIWEEDWFILMPPMYKLLWSWITNKCDHAGIWKPNLQSFIKFNGEVDLEKAIEFFNEKDKIRLTKLKNGKYFLPGFFVFQYGEKINLNNKVHKSIYQLYKVNEVNLKSIRGLKEVIEGLKEKDKEKDIDKEIKEEEVAEIIFPFNSEKFKKMWSVWLAYRKEINKKYKSPKSEQAALKQLSEFNEEFSIKLIERSIAGGYQGLVFDNTKSEYLKNGKQNSKEASTGADYDSILDSIYRK